MKKEKLEKQYIAMLSEGCVEEEKISKNPLNRFVELGLKHKEHLKSIPVLGSTAKFLYRKLLMRLLK